MAKVLVVDDAMFMRKTIKLCLEKNGHEVIGEASNGVEAISQYKMLKPDLVMMDITMPELDGLGAIRGIKEFDPSASIIVCSAMGQQGIVIEAIKSGAKDFVVKPFTDETLMAAVRKMA